MGNKRKITLSTEEATIDKCVVIWKNTFYLSICKIVLKVTICETRPDNMKIVYNFEI